MDLTARQVYKLQTKINKIIKTKLKVTYTCVGSIDNVNQPTHTWKEQLAGTKELDITFLENWGSKSMTKSNLAQEHLGTEESPTT
jgi:hypothetical protein